MYIHVHVQTSEIALIITCTCILHKALYSTGGNLLQPVGGGKPIQLAGKPLSQARGQLLQITGKGGQQLIQTPQGALPISIIPQGGGAAGVVTLSQSRTPPGKRMKQL